MPTKNMVNRIKAFMIASKGEYVSASKIQKELDIDYNTTVKILGFLVNETLVEFILISNNKRYYRWIKK